MDTQPDGFPRRRRGIASRLVEGEAVVIHPGENRVFVLNRAAAAAWRLADGTRRASEIAAAVAARFHVPEDDTARDIENLWRDLRERDLLETLPAAGKPPPHTQGEDGEGPYETPAVVSEEVLEVLAAVCSSARTSSPVFSCRAFGACQIPFT